MSTLKEKFHGLREDALQELGEQERKDMYKARLGGLSAVELATHMLLVQQLGEQIENWGKYLNAELDVVRLILIPEAMEKEGLESPLNVAGVGRVSLTPDCYVSIGGEEPDTDYKAEFYGWLRENEMGSLITESVNSSTLKAWVKSRIGGGKSYPQDLLKVTPFTRASITKTKSK